MKSISLRSYIFLFGFSALAVSSAIKQDFSLHANVITLWVFMLATTSIIQDLSKPDFGLVLLGSAACLSLFFISDSGLLYFLIPFVLFLLSSFFYIAIAFQLIKKK
jgi:cell division protein FtsW (lipid II flippase)